jgi:S1-C subfamily serine protease
MGRRTVVGYGRLGKLPALFIGLASLGGFSPFQQSNVTHLAYGQQRPAAAAADAKDSDGLRTVELAGLEQQFESVARKISPSVVAISASCSKQTTDEGLRSDDMTGGKLEAILDKGVRTVGTGFIVDESGYIVTNEHVIMESEQVWVTTDTGKIYPAVVVGSDPRADLAVLKIPASGLTPVKFANPESIRRGMWSIAIGNPYGLATGGEMAMAVGVVSALDRALPKLAQKENRLYAGLIQTTAEINPGNSGGPLIDINGNVIGINTAVILPQKQVNGIGFAMPITARVQQLIHDLKEGREVTYGFLGVTVTTPTARERKTAGAADNVGAKVEVIDANSPAGRSKLAVDDMVVSINGITVRDSDHFVRLIGEAPVDRPSAIVVYRAGKPVTIDITAGRRQGPSVAVTRENRRLRWNGMVLGSVPPNWVGPNKKPEPGVMVLAVDANCTASTKFGVRQGTVITTVAGRPVASLEDLQQVLNDTPTELCALQTLNPGSETVASTSGQ